MTGTPVTAPDHVWLFVLGHGQSHQFREPVAPDEEGVLVALCGDEVMAFRTLDEYRHPACLGCLLKHGADEADKLEAWAAAQTAAANWVTS